jgi:maltooligosyltrehalose trehalohydrolase
LTTFRVWAPRPESVALRVADSSMAVLDIPMERGSGDWWEVDFAAPPGARYQYVVDGDALPDPRSPWQPQGVHGPSATVNHAAFQWTDHGFQAPPLSSALVCELHIGTFTPEGTFDSTIQNLGYLADLGVTHLQIMPVAEFPGRWGWGYDGVDLYAPHHDYGGPDALKRLVDACHARGLAVILDVVYNHLGPSGNYLARFGPYYTTRHHTPWGEAINFDSAGSDEVRRFFCDNALMWMREYHMDGLRFDAVHAYVDTSATHILEQLAAETARLEAELGRNLLLIAESDLNDPRIIRDREVGGYGIDAQWSDDFHHALHAALTGERDGYYADFGSIAQIAKALRRAWVYDGCYSSYRRRTHGRPVELSGWKFLGYMQNHDQIGNRARGERSSALMSLGQLKIAAALVFTGPFVPMIFQGEEWGASTPFLYFTQHEDPELARAVSEGRVSEFETFGWDASRIPDPQNPATFERSKLDWEECGREPHAGILEWHRNLIRLRRACQDLLDGDFDRVQTNFDEDEKWLLVRRGGIATACNLSDVSREVPVGPAFEILLASTAAERKQSCIRLPAESVAVLRCS